MGRSTADADAGGAGVVVTTEAAGAISSGAAATSAAAAATSSVARASWAGVSTPRSSLTPERNWSAREAAAKPGTELLVPLAKRARTAMKLTVRARRPLRWQARRTAPTPPDEAASASFVRQEVVSSELSYAADSSIAVFLVFPCRERLVPTLRARIVHFTPLRAVRVVMARRVLCGS
jgi:hypothetical protein